MNLSTTCKNLLPGQALVLATSAFAANNVNEDSVEVFEPRTIGGHQLAPGRYKLTWHGTSSRIELMILSQGKLVATVPARLIELGQAHRENATESQKNDDGSQSLTRSILSARSTRWLSAWSRGQLTRHLTVAASK